MTYRIDPEAKLVHMIGSGRLTDEEMLACVVALRSDPGLVPDAVVLSDMRAITMGFSSQGVRKMLDIMVDTADRRAETKGAVVVGNDVTFGMARMMSLMADERVSPVFRVFRDLDSACEWLGIDPP